MRLLPIPYPDELIGSIIARGLLRSGLPSDRFLLRLTGRDVGTVSFFLPSDIGLMGTAAGMTPEQLLWHHTPFPYVVAFMTPAVAHRFKAKALANSASSGKTLSSLVQSCTQGWRGLRFCPQCRDEELRGLGETYWHRSQNLPGVFVCTRHGCALLLSPPVSVGRAYQIGLPHHQQGIAVGLRATEVLLAVAKRSADLLSAPGARGLWPLITYRVASAEKGYEIQGRWANGGQLSRDLSSFYGSKVLASCGCTEPGTRGRAWPTAMLRPGTSVPFSPVKHVLLATFLEAQTAAPKAVEWKRPGKKTRDYVRLDKELAAKLRVALNFAIGNAERIAVRDLFSGTGLWATYRHQCARMPLSTAVVAEYRRSEAAQRQIGRRPRRRTKAHSPQVAAPVSEVEAVEP